MSKKCSFIREDMSQCQAYAVNNSEFCFTHSPEHSEQKKAAVIKGGQQIKKPRVDTELIEITKAKDVMLLLARCINEVRQGLLSPKESNAIGYLANILLGAIRETELEIKLEEIENALKFRKENR